ncbi:MAG: hypothetical protein JJE49_02005 [Peptostreptococcaceae bacterium]|nr:hypothetical protein [Peptostreptococcaceae bacterium]
MKCGVRFCGGCNPRYDRGTAYEIIKQNLQEKIQFEYAQEGVTYDILLVIGGCTNCCASYEQYIAKRGLIKIWDMDEIDKTIKILKDFE